MKWEQNSDGTFSVSGEGALRPIVIDAATRAEARQGWMLEFGRQYAEAECMTAVAYMVEIHDGH